ncbi:Ribosomal RNA small subunit methyltransferase C [Buchnera aphidicola (Eriosoma grossulariae)]
MHKLNNESQLLNKHKHFLKNKNIIFYGDIKDCFPILFSSQNTKIYTTKYNIWTLLTKTNKNIFFNFKIQKQHCINTNLIIYYWPKNKKEAKFQLKYLFSCQFLNCQLLVVGKNNSGVRSVQNILKKMVKIEKLDSAKHCSLFLGNIQKKNTINLEKIFSTHILNNIVIKTLPGVFGHSGFDSGTLFLASTFTKKTTGKVLDIGCGSGILSILLHQKSEKVNLTLIDIDLLAIKSSKKNFEINNIKGKILASDLFSNIHIHEKFDLIISNPPIHEGIKFTKKIIKKIILESCKYLKPKGELRFVTQSSLLFFEILKKQFSIIKILKKNNSFIIYQAWI